MFEQQRGTLVANSAPLAGREPVEPWLVGLNDEQTYAVLHDGGPLLVVAGAGTGKTRTLAARVARLLADGVEPDRILLLTFSRRASDEMLSRVAALTDQRCAARVWGGTFHAVANRLLRFHGQMVGLSPSFTVLDQGDATDLFALVRSEHLEDDPSGGRRFPKPDTIANIYSRTVNSQQPLSEVLRTRFPWCADHVDGLAAIFRAYSLRKRTNEVLDYDDLLLFWRALLAAPDAGQTIRDRFDHVLVDEYQDTNAIQADIVFALTQTSGCLTAVGDDAQAIYGFRAASAANLADVPQRWPGTTVVTLEQNYRSISPILDAANAVLAHEGRHLPKELWSERPGGTRPLLVSCADEAAQSRWVADRILELRELGAELREQAVLYRAGHHSDHLELELTRRDIPFVKFGGLKFLEAAHVKDLMALLRVLENPADELAWTRILRLLDGVGPKTARRIIDELGVVSGSSGALGRFLVQDVQLPSAAQGDALSLREALAACTDPDLGVAAQIERLAAFCEHVFDRHYENAAARLADVAELGVAASGYQSRERFLTELVLEPPDRTGELAGSPHLDDDYLVLSTIHSAKGSEWRSVILLHGSDGNIPSDLAVGDRDQLDEELRLLYVALTRAKDHLAVTFPLRYHPQRFGRDPRHLYGQLSRFLHPVRDRFDEVTSGTLDRLSGSLELAGSRVGLADEVDTLLESLWSN